MLRISGTLIFCAITVICPSVLPSQSTHRPLAITASGIGGRDVSQLMPGSEYLFRFGITPGLDVRAEFPANNKWNFVLGYRLKNMWVSTKTKLITVYRYVGAHHSFPLLLSRNFTIGANIEKRFFLNCSAGIVPGWLDRGLLLSSMSTVMEGGTWTGTYFEQFEHKKGWFSLSADVAVYAAFPLGSRMHLLAGSGYNQGFWHQAKGAYMEVGPTGLIASGNMATKGSYPYISFGLRYRFR